MNSLFSNLQYARSRARDLKVSVPKYLRVQCGKMQDNGTRFCVVRSYYDRVLWSGFAASVNDAKAIYINMLCGYQ
jgi:hypothetical protein